MTCWHMAKLTVGLKTPLRCGDRPFGFVARTLPFVPGHVPLMAMVPCLVGKLQLPERPESYSEIQHFLEENLRFTPFFILDPESKEPLFDLSADNGKIESSFLRSKYGVAIDYGGRNAIDQMLFEIEAIQPYSRENDVVRRTYLQGYLFWKAVRAEDLEVGEEGAINNISFKKIIDESQWGGERNKGFGKVFVDRFENDDSIWGKTVQLKDKDPLILWPRNCSAPFFLRYPSGDDTRICRTEMAEHISGKLMPLTGRVFDSEKGPGQNVFSPEIVWEIGWKSRKDLSLRLNLRTAGLAE